MPDQPTEDDQQDLLLSCRYGDLPDIQLFVSTFSPDAINAIQDDNGNTVLHMVAGNGHTDVLSYLLPLVSPRLLIRQNHAGSTPLHWAVVNQHLEVMQALVQFSSGPGIGMIDIKNAAGRSPLGEAEIAGWDDGARWLVQVMHLDEAKEQVEEETTLDPSQAIEVEIQDADGQVARMTLNPEAASGPDQEPS
ncbi:cytoplasmic protein [Butyriboletus roseoflavus]|nr:cytoplasmic protein [Butyriboletus roseoflavus]